MNPPSGPFRLRAIQCLRGVAAMAVLFQHAVYFAGQTEGWDMMSFRRLLIGTAGVLLFFMISGFVMAMQTGRDPLRFGAHRVSRIYPGYLLSLTASALLFALFHPETLRTLTFDFSLFLVPSGNISGGFHVPYWTLVYEMFFYSLLFVMISLKFRPAWYAAFMLAWTLAILSGPTLGVRNGYWAIVDIRTIFFSPFNLSFIGGFLLFGALQGGQRLALILWIVALASEFLWRGAVMSPFFAEVNLGAGVLIVLTSWLAAAPWPRLLVKLGDWSYGIYLMHLPVIYLLYLFLKDGPGFWPSFAALFGAGLAVGSAFGLFEYRLYRHYMRPLADGLSSRPAPRPL